MRCREWMPWWRPSGGHLVDEFSLYSLYAHLLLSSQALSHAYAVMTGETGTHASFSLRSLQQCTQAASHSCCSLCYRIPTCIASGTFRPNPTHIPRAFGAGLRRRSSLIHGLTSSLESMPSCSSALQPRAKMCWPLETCRFVVKIRGMPFGMRALL